MTNNKDSSYNSWELIKDCWSLLKGNRIRFFIATSFSIASGLMPFLIVYLLGKIVDFFVKYQHGDSLSFFYLAVVGIALAGGFQIWARFFAKWRIYFIASELRMKTRILAMTKLAEFELKWHEKEETGSKIQKINTGGENLYSFFKFFLDSVIPIITGIIGGVIALTFLNWKYVMFALIYIVLYLFSEYYFNRKISFWQDKLNSIKEKVSGKIHESATNILTVKTLGLKNALKSSAEEYEKEYLNVSLKARLANQNKFKAVKIFSAIVYAGFVLLLGLDTLSGAITVGSIIIFIGYFDRIKGAMDNITNNLSDYIEIKSGVGRIMTLLDKKTIEKESYPYVDIPTTWEEIVFRNVSFKYKDKWILKNFNLTIKKGEKIGIVGQSGEGKSTILKLLLGLYSPQEGSITIGNIPLEKAKTSSLTKTITAVLQDCEMFNLSLKENISITSESFDEILFNTAIRATELSEFIKKLPKGIETLIGEKGYKVSGGERQRIGIARAIYKNSDIIIMDEATSNLDSKTESALQNNMKSLLSDKTLLVIAHRLSTLKEVDSIIVLKDGRISERGNFDALIKKKGQFYDLWNRQRNLK